MAVIRGERDLTSLAEAGICFTMLWGSSGERRIVAKASRPFTVAPDPGDLVAGLLANQQDPRRLSDWASFILAADVVDLAAVDSAPEGDELLNALWDASFDWSNPGSGAP
jgi:hypothetical protein